MLLVLLLELELPCCSCFSIFFFISLARRSSWLSPPLDFSLEELVDDFSELGRRSLSLTSSTERLEALGTFSLRTTDFPDAEGGLGLEDWDEVPGSLSLAEEVILITWFFPGTTDSPSNFLRRFSNLSSCSGGILLFLTVFWIFSGCFSSDGALTTFGGFAGLGFGLSDGGVLERDLGRRLESFGLGGVDVRGRDRLRDLRRRPLSGLFVPKPQEIEFVNYNYKWIL